MMAAAHDTRPRTPLLDLDDLLHGWDEIAQAIQRSPSWCRMMSTCPDLPVEVRLPAIRLGPGKRARVAITRRDLSAWAARFAAWKESNG